MSRHIEPVNPPALPRPVGYSYGYEVRSGRLLFIAGTVARDADNRVVGAGDLPAQFRQVCENWKTVLTAAGAAFTDVVKLTIYVVDVDEYKKQARAIGGVYREYFGRHFPAMTLVGARDLYDRADGCLIEIEGVAVIP
ncbi:MAG: RidA family protein [Candidatus Rokuibacteriota bacterium]